MPNDDELKENLMQLTGELFWSGEEHDYIYLLLEDESSAYSTNLPTWSHR
jgi:hypothetical protein